jgi:hypothetical protein
MVWIVGVKKAKNIGLTCAVKTCTQKLICHSVYTVVDVIPLKHSFRGMISDLYGGIELCGEN